MNNDFSLKKIKEILNNLVSSAPNLVIENSWLILLQTQLWNHEADHSKIQATKILYITTKLNKIQV